MEPIDISQITLDIDTVYHIMNNNVKICISSYEKIVKSHQVIQNIVEQNKIVYGVTTGFGSLKDKIVSQADTSELQINLIKSHAVGVGKKLPLNIVKGMLLLRINTLIKGYSGINPETISYLVERFNQGIFSKVPSQGSVGASGDLAPLSHLIVGYLGEGYLFDPKEQRYRKAKEVLNDYNIELLKLGPKEGLALNNGTTFMTTHLVKAMKECDVLLRNTTVISALTLEALKGTHRALHSGIHQMRNQLGQIEVAKEMREILDGSESHEINSKGKVQDAYSLRCIPQVHGICFETFEFVRNIVNREINAVTDNPLIIEDDVISGGNFHGQYLSQSADYMSISMTTISNISERRIERLVNTQHSKFPSFLVDKEENLGKESGFMIIQYTAAALCAENRSLSNSASVHSIPTCENSEDHVSMGAYSVRKLLNIVENTKKVLGLELLCAVQAKEFIEEKTTDVLEEVIKKVRKEIPRLLHDRYMGEDLEKIFEIVSEKLA